MTHDNAGSVPSRKLTAAPYISVSASTGPNGPMMASAPSRRPAAAPSENLRSQELAREMPLLVHSGPLPNFVSDSITCPTTAEQLCHQLLAWIGKYLILAFRGRGGGSCSGTGWPSAAQVREPIGVSPLVLRSSNKQHHKAPAAAVLCESLLTLLSRVQPGLPGRHAGWWMAPWSAVRGLRNRSRGAASASRLK